MERIETREVMIISNGLRGTIMELDDSCGENFKIYKVETRRKLPDGSTRRESDWYFRNEFVRYTAFRIPSAAVV